VIKQAKGKRMRKKSDNIHSAQLARRNSAELREEWTKMLTGGAKIQQPERAVAVHDDALLMGA
jgi:hypothetical protein